MPRGAVWSRPRLCRAVLPIFFFLLCFGYKDGQGTTNLSTHSTTNVYNQTALRKDCRRSKPLLASGDLRLRLRGRRNPNRKRTSVNTETQRHWECGKMCLHRRNFSCKIEEIADLRGRGPTWSADVSDHLACINSTTFRLRYDEATRVLDHDFGEAG